jgi:hypothetical protein
MAHVNDSFIPNTHLRGEIMWRWQLLSTSEIEESCVDLSKLIAFLQNRYGFVRRRAEQEVHLFYIEFRDRLRMAA